MPGEEMSGIEAQNEKDRLASAGRGSTSAAPAAGESGTSPPPAELALVLAPPGRPIFVDGQMVTPIAGAQGIEEAKRAFACFEAAEKWHPAVTKLFFGECGIQTMDGLLAHFKTDEDWQDVRAIKDS